MRNAGLTIESIDQFVFHQANLRIIENVQQQLGIPSEKVYINIEKYGNTSAASVPMALVEAVAAGRIKPGDKILMVAFGGGLHRRRRRGGVDRRSGARLPGPRRADAPGRAAGRRTRARGRRALMFDLSERWPW